MDGGAAGLKRPSGGLKRPLPIYSKNEQANLRPDQLKLLRRTIEEDLK